MRRALGPSAAAAIGLAGCTFLITFDEVPVDDAGLEAGTGPDAADAPAAPDAAADAPPVTDAAAELDLSKLGSCDGMVNGLYCGNNQIKDYPGSRDDLVACDGGAVASVTHCDGGSGCIRMPNPQPDQCDECWRKADGFYCGRDMPGWSSRNARVLVRCMAGGQVGITVCTNGCVSNGAASACQ